MQVKTDLAWLHKIVVIKSLFRSKFCCFKSEQQELDMRLDLIVFTLYPKLVELASLLCNKNSHGQEVAGLDIEKSTNFYAEPATEQST